MEQHITELTMLLIYLTGWEEDAWGQVNYFLMINNSSR
jgi:hypothetical protein